MEKEQEQTKYYYRLIRYVRKRILLRQTRKLAVKLALNRYLFNFSWLGRPIIQFPQDIYALQELIFKVKPDLIVETGIAHGGSLMLSASILSLLGGNGNVIGIDTELRDHNRREIEASPFSKRITLLDGSSTSENVVYRVKELANYKKNVMVFLDSNHTEEHVLEELKIYSEIVTVGSYIVVFDGIIEFMPKGSNKNRPWDRGNNPYTAIKKFLKENKSFVVDEEIENRLLITAAPKGFLKKIK